MKASIITSEYPPCILGGAGVHIEAMCSELAKLIDVEVMFLGEINQQGIDRLPLSQPTKIPLHSFMPAHGFYGSESYFEILRGISAGLSSIKSLESSEIVHTHSIAPHLTGTVARTIFGAKHVATFHSMERDQAWERARHGGGYDLKILFEELSITHADAVIAVSDSIKSSMLHWYPYLDPNKITAIPNGIDHERYWPDKATDLLPKVNFDWNSSFILFVGRISLQKGILPLLKATHFLPPNTPLVIRAGSPGSYELQKRFQSELANLRNEGHDVLWLEDGLGPEPLRQLYSHATLLCSPSIYEPFGMVNLEALACGTPVVASAVGGIKEIVVDGVNGLLVNDPPDGVTADKDKESTFCQRLAESMMKLLQNPELASRMGEAGRQYSMKFSWANAAKKTVQLYESLL